ncbi:MAG: cache domain-containing protein [Flavisolibacter sp.]
MSTINQNISGFFSSLARRYAPAIITLLLLTAAYFFYFNVVVSKNSLDLKERNFRGLDRIANNISMKLNSYTEKNVTNFLSEYEGKKRDSSSLITEYGLELESKPINHPPISRQQKDSLAIIQHANHWKIVFNDASNSILNASMTVDKFLSPLLRKDLFTHYLFAYGDSIIYDDLNISYYSLSSIRSNGNAKDSVKRTIVLTDEIWNIDIGGKEYKLFLFPFFALGKHKFVIGGYIPMETYNSEKNYIPIYGILWMIIGIILIILMFPLFTISIMRRSEQLHVSNAISSLASLHVLGVMAVLIPINSYVYFTMGVGPVKKNLTILADSIQSTFTREVSAALYEIDAAQKTQQSEWNLKDSIFILPHKKPIKGTDSRLPAFGSYYPYFHYLTWTDSSGKNKFVWTTKKHLPGKIDVHDREYFKAIQNEELWNWNNQLPFYLTAISSWNANEKLAIIATPYSLKNSDSIRLVTLSGPFRSLFQPIVPEGYGFCITNDKGDVLFHIDATRILSENLLEESDDNTKLQTYLHNHSAGNFSARYSGTNQQFYIQPIGGLPYFIVTFRDMRSIWSEDLDVISVCTILSLMNLIVILIAILLIQASGYKHSLLSKQSILFTWLRPNRFLKKAYAKVTAVYLLSMLIQTGSLLFYSSTNHLALIGIPFCFSFLLISYAYYQFAVIPTTDPSEKYIKYKSAVWLLIFFGFVISVFLINLNSGQSWILGSLAILALAVLLIEVISKKKTDNKFRNAFRKMGINGWINRNFRWWYFVSIFSFIAATAIMPLLIFYCLSFKEERLLSLKRNQLEFAHRIQQLPKDFLQVDALQSIPSYHNPFHYNLFADTILFTAKEIAFTSRIDSDQFVQLYEQLNPAFSLYSREVSNLKNNQNNYNWIKSEEKNQLELNYQFPSPLSKIPSINTIRIISHLPSGKERTSQAVRQNILGFLLLIGSLILLMVGLYFLCSYLLKRIFFDGYDPSMLQKQSEIPLIKDLSKEENIFIYGSPNSGKYSMIQNYLKSYKSVFQIDIVRLLKEDVDNILKEIENSTNGK